MEPKRVAVDMESCVLVCATPVGTHRSRVHALPETHKAIRDPERVEIKEGLHQNAELMDMVDRELGKSR